MKNCNLTYHICLALFLSYLRIKVYVICKEIAKGHQITSHLEIILFAVMAKLHQQTLVLVQRSRICYLHIKTMQKSQLQCELYTVEYVLLETKYAKIWPLCILKRFYIVVMHQLMEPCLLLTYI